MLRTFGPRAAAVNGPAARPVSSRRGEGRDAFGGEGTAVCGIGWFCAARQRTWVAARDRERLQALRRYAARSAVSVSRLAELPDDPIGRARNKPVRDGNTAVMLGSARRRHEAARQSAPGAARRLAERARVSASW
jgi:hypothetical protein